MFYAISVTFKKGRKMNHPGGQGNNAFSNNSIKTLIHHLNTKCVAIFIANMFDKIEMKLFFA